MNKRYVMVTGSRNHIGYGEIRDGLQHVIAKYPGLTHLVHGDCAGADQLADRVGLELGLEREAVPAKWTRFGTAAGPIRNRAMIHIYEPVVVAAFPLPSSRGTWDAVNAAKSAGIPVEVFK